MEQQHFLIDLYGYKNYNGEELTDDFLNEGDYIDVDCGAEGNFGDFRKFVEDYEKEGTLITEFFIKQRVLRDNPIFKHIMNGGKIRIQMI